MRLQQTFHALGSETCITLVLKEQDQNYGALLLYQIQDAIVQFERQFSRFLPESELTLFNLQAGHKTKVSSEFSRLLTAARDISLQTKGLYNPCILPALQRAGYKGSWPNPQEVKSVIDFSKRSLLAKVEDIVIHPTWAHIPANCAIDFGGIGKGYLLDQLKALLNLDKVKGYWISLGGDILCFGRDIDDRPWKIGVEQASSPGDILSEVSNKDGKLLAIATSGIIKRQGLNKEGIGWHHIIDPRSGEPAKTNLSTVTVTCDQATIADIYAKCTIIAGIDWLDKKKEEGVISSYIIQKQNKAVVAKGEDIV